MGMFDSIRVKQVILCPNCRAKCKDFQTKQLDNCLDVYKEGTTRRKVTERRAAQAYERNKYGFPFVVLTGSYHYDAHPRNRTIHAYDYCKCEHFVNQQFKFNSKGRLTRIGQPRASKP